MDTTHANHGPEPTEYCNHGYYLLVQPGAVTLNAPYKDSKVQITEGVRAYDAKALRKLNGMSGRQAAMAMRLLGWQQSDASELKCGMDDDAYLAGSGSRVDQWMLGAKRWLDRAVCRVILLEPLSERLEGLAAYAEEGNAAFTAAAAEIDGLLAELERLRGGIPERHAKEIAPRFIEAGHRMTGAKRSFESAAKIMTTMADMRRQMKAAYYPSQPTA